MRRLRRAILVLGVSGGLGAAACTDEPAGCVSNADCAADELCNLLAGTCVEDLSKIAVSEGRFEGELTCRLAGDLAATTLEGTSSVVGQLGGDRRRLDGGAVCVVQGLEDGSAGVAIFVFGRNRNPAGEIEGLQLGLELARDELGGTAELAAADDPLAVGPTEPGTVRAVLYSVPIVGGDPQGDAQLLAYGSGGTLEVSGSGEIGDVLRGRVALTFTPIDGGPPPLDMDTYLDEFPELACAHLRACFGEAWTEWSFFGPGCEAFLRRRIVDADPQLRADIEAGRVLFDADAAAACVATWEAGDCSLPNQGRSYLCDEFSGSQPRGGPCANDDHCGAVASYCAFSGVCPGTCRAKPGIGQACDDDAPCADGLACMGGSCVSPGGEGAPCGASAPPCRFGLVCAGGETPTCRAPLSLFSASLGQPCGVEGGPWCEAGLSCVQSAGALTATCRSRTGSRGVCAYGFLSQCPPDEYCTATAAGEVGRCSPLPSPGQPCRSAVGSLPCPPDATCSNGVCVRLGSIGDACGADVECLSGRCTRSLCAATNGCEP